MRESGAIEQDADIVCFIHRPEYYTKSSEDAEGNDIRGKAEFIVAKHRSGSTADVDMRFVAKYARFENWEPGLNLEGMTYESKMNSDSNDPIADIASPQLQGNPMMPPPNVDFLAGPGEEKPPF